MNVRCIKCQGKGHCGRSFCPIYAKSEAMFKVRKEVKEDFSGSAPNVFVGRYGYPNVNVGILSPSEQVGDAWLYDAPRHWAEKDFGIRKIIDYRSSLVNSRYKMDVKLRHKFLDVSQEVGMASKPVDIEVGLEAKPKFKLSFNPELMPMGPNAKLKKVQVVSNPFVDSRVDKVVADTDFKANDAILHLYKKNFDENFLSKLLSIGNIGVKKNRKLVPTRWSITAVDDNLGKDLIKKARDFQTCDYSAYFGSYLGNYYLILFFPDVWSYELFETYAPRASWNVSDEVQFSTDHEGYYGRKTYAENCVGGYYAARLAVLEKLVGMKRQASVLCLRFITGEYAAPLGVWVVREATRKAMASSAIKFASKELMMTYAKHLVKKKFGIELDNILKESFLLKEMKQQSKLREFF